MARILAFAGNRVQPLSLDLLGAALVCACALALALAGQPLPPIQ